MVNKSVIIYKSSIEEGHNVMRRRSQFTTCLFLLLTAFCLWPIPLRAQQPQALAGQPIYAVNAKYVQGVGPGYWPTAGSQLTLNLASGTVVCNSTVQSYAGGTLTLAANATNYIYLDGSNNCAPAFNTTGFTGTTVPIAKVATNGTSITSITDVRTMFDWATPSGGTLTSVGLSLPSIFSVTGSPVTTSGTLTGSLATESNNMVLAGPSSGSAGLPTFRALVGADLPTPASTTLGGIKSLACGTGQFLNSISTSGGANCATPTSGGGSNYGLGNGTTVIDASLYAGSDFAAKVNAAIGALSSSGGTVDARGLTGSLTMGSSIVVGSDTQPVTLLLPKGMINRASGAQFKYFIGTQIIGQGKCFNSPTCTVIQGSGVPDTAFVYGGAGPYATYVYLADFVVLSGSYGGTATGVGIDFSHTMSSRVENVLDWAEVALVVGGANGSCECYNTFYSNDFRGGNDSSGIGVQLLAGANSNYFYSGTYWGYRGVYHGGWGNYFYGPDIESNTIGFDDAGGGLQIYGGYWEAVGTGVLLESGTDGAYISGGFPGVSIVDNSGNSSNFYFDPGAEQQGTLALFPLRFGLQDELLFGNSGLNGYNDFYGIRGDRGGTIAVEVLYEQALQRTGFNGHAPLKLGPGMAYGGFVTVGTAVIQALGAPPAPIVAVQGTPTTTSSCSYALVAHDWNGGITLPSAFTAISNCPNPLGTLTTPVAVATAGTNYQVNDIVSVVQSGASNGQLKVTSVGSGGAVTGLSVNTVGSGYLTANALPTTGGNGTGLQVSITSVYVTVTPPQMDGVWEWDYLKGDTAHSLATATRATITDVGQTPSPYTTPTTDTTGSFCIRANCVTSLTQGTVTSVGLSLPSIFSVTGSPVTAAGTLTATLAAANANTVFGNCTSSSSTPAFCTLTGAMLPAPTASTLGGIQSVASTPHQWISSIDSSGVPHQAAISTGDLPAHLANMTNAWCYGTLGSTSGAYYFGGFGGVQMACGSLTTTLTGGMPLSTAGTVKNLRCAAGEAGHGSSSGVVHVYDNGTSESLTCTMGTGTGCSDSTDSFNYSTGDLLQFSVASGGSGETLASVSCSAEVWVSGN
jgi:hypothetical protein